MAVGCCAWGSAAIRRESHFRRVGEGLVVKETVFTIPKMDCPSEERLVRMALDPEPDVRSLVFDLEERRLIVRHDGPDDALLARLEPLGFGARILQSGEAADTDLPSDDRDRDESRVLKQLLVINGAMFLLEVVVGWLAQSTGLLADAVDMFADAAVYGISLYAVGRAAAYQRRAAVVSGVAQALLALGVLVEVVRRAVVGSEPEAPLIMGMAIVALVANVSCMALLSRHRTGGVHMKASWIFSTNDVVANLGVLLAGVLVVLLDSPIPDLVVGTIIGLVVLSGAVRILRLSRS